MNKQHSNFETLFYKYVASLTINFPVSLTLEKILFFMSSLQVWSLLIFTLISDVEEKHMDSFTIVIFSLSKVLCVRDLIPKGLYEGIVCLVYLYLGSIFILMIIWMLRYDKFKLLSGNSSQMQAHLGLIHSKVLVFWINLILIRSWDLIENKEIVITGYVFLVWNCLFGLLSSIYSTSFGICSNDFGTLNSIYPAVNIVFKIILSLITIAQTSRLARTVLILVAVCHYLVQFFIFYLKNPFIKFKTLKLAYVHASIGLTISVMLLVIETFFASRIKITHDKMIYPIMILLAPLIKISRQAVEPIAVNGLEKFYLKGIKSKKEAIKVLSSIDYFLSIENLCLTRKDPKFLYAFKLISERNSEITDSFKPNERGMIHLDDIDIIDHFKYLKIYEFIQEYHQNHKESNKLRIFLAEINLKKRNDHQNCLFQLQDLHHKKFGKYLFSEHLKRKALSLYMENLSNTSHALDVENYVNTEEVKELLCSKIMSAIRLQHDFLMKISATESNLKEYLSLVKRIEAEKVEIEFLRKKMQINNERGLDILPLHTFYLAAVLNQPFSAEQEIDEYNRRVKYYQTKIDLDVNNINLHETSNLILRFSLKKSTAGKILSVNENISYLGWDQKEIEGADLSKILPSFLNINKKNFLEIFLKASLQYQKEYLGPIKIFLVNKNGYLKPFLFKSFLNPSAKEDMNMIAFLKPVEDERRYAIVEQDSVLAFTENLVKEMNTSSKIQNTSSINEMISSQSNDLNIQTTMSKSHHNCKNPKLYKLMTEFKFVESEFNLLTKKYKLLTLEKKFEEESSEARSDNSSSHLSRRKCSESVNLENIITTLEGNENKDLNKKTLEFETFNQESIANHLEPDPKVIQQKILSDPMKYLTSRVLDGDKIDKDIILEESSVRFSSNTNAYKKIQNSLLLDPPMKSSFILKIFTICFFLLSSILLITYYIFSNFEFDNISNELTTLYFTIKEVQEVIEVQKIASLYYMTDKGMLSLFRYASLGLSSAYHPVVRDYFLTHLLKLEDAHKNITRHIQFNDRKVLDVFYDRKIPLRENISSVIIGDTSYINLQGLAGRMISSCYILYNLNEKIRFDNLDLQFVLANSKDETLLQFEKIGLQSYYGALQHLDNTVTRIGIFSGVIFLTGIINLLLFIMRERSSRTKKRHFLNVISHLDNKEIIKSVSMLSEFLSERKKSNPASFSLIWYDKLMEQDSAYVPSKKDFSSSVSNLRRLSTMKIPVIDFLKIISLISALVILLVLPFFIIACSFIVSGDRTHIQNLIDAQYNTELSYYKLRLLIACTNEYFMTNGSYTLLNRPIGIFLDSLLDELAYFQSYLASIQDSFNDPDVKFLISGNLCLLFQDGFCPTLADAAATRGIIGLNSFQLKTFATIKSEFDNSNRDLSDIYKAINDAEGLKSEMLDVFYNFETYDRLLRAEFDEIQSVLSRVQEEIIKIIIANFVVNIIVGGIVTKLIQDLMYCERNNWIKMVRRIPFRIAMNSKILNAYLNDPVKRNFE